MRKPPGPLVVGAELAEGGIGRAVACLMTMADGSTGWNHGIVLAVNAEAERRFWNISGACRRQTLRGLCRPGRSVKSGVVETVPMATASGSVVAPRP